MLTYEVLSKPGGRDVNEDAVGVRLADRGGLFVLADGLGSYGYGDVAASYTVRHLLQAYRPQSPSSAQRFLIDSIQEIQAGLHCLQQETMRYRSIRTTLAAAHLQDGKLTLAHAGDSRIYLFGKHRAIWRTTDHSVPQMRALSGQIRESQIAHHPDRSRLLNALGGDTENLKIDLTIQMADSWQAMLLCSDGFWEYVPQGQMQRTLRYSHSCGEWLAQMEKSALKNGRRSVMDNYSAIAVWFRTDEPKISSL